MSEITEGFYVGKTSEIKAARGGSRRGIYCRAAIRFILGRNIVCGNALSMMCVDENQQDTGEPIVFSEWAFVTGNLLR